jgi:magnesium transporter
MTRAVATEPHSSTTTPARDGSGPGPTIRVIYRDSAGTIHHDWPAAGIAQVIADRGGTAWIDVEDRRPAAELIGGEVETLLRDTFHFHPLAIEDALQETHVSKVDDWGEYLYMVFHSIDFDRDKCRLRLHELDIFLGKNYLVTYHNQPVREFDEHRRNIERDPVNRCRNGADHILYHLLDLVVAAYLPVIENLDEAIDKAQDEVFGRPTPRTLQAIFKVKRAALRLNRVLAPEREVINRLARDDYDPIPAEHRIYFRDIYDHLVRIHDITESLRDLISGALDTYLSAISNRTNDIMKTLTIVTVMFLPITFLTGFFGMNFFGENLSFHTSMPRHFLFAITCLTLAVMPAVMWYWSKRKGWF